MKKIAIFLTALMMSVNAFSQAQITTRKEKLSDFATRTMKVVLPGTNFIDPILQEALNNTWSLSPFEFCSVDEFNSLKNNEEYYFMLPVKVKYKKEEQPGIMMLTIVKGKANAKTINDMVEVVSMPVCAADFPSGREAAMLPGLVDIMQGYIAKSLQGNFSGIGSYVTPLSKSARRKAVIAEEDIASLDGVTYLHLEFRHYAALYGLAVLRHEDNALVWNCSRSSRGCRGCGWSCRRRSCRSLCHRSGSGWSELGE